jgi:hypothetical protein
MSIGEMIEQHTQQPHHLPEELVQGMGDVDVGDGVCHFVTG